MRIVNSLLMVMCDVAAIAFLAMACHTADVQKQIQLDTLAVFMAVSGGRAEVRSNKADS